MSKNRFYGNVLDKKREVVSITNFIRKQQIGLISRLNLRGNREVLSDIFAGLEPGLQHLYIGVLEAGFLIQRAVQHLRGGVA